MIGKVLQNILGLTPFFAFIPVFSLVKGWRFHSIPLYLVGAYVLLNVVTGIISVTLWRMNMSNLWITHYYILLELPLILFAISEAFRRKEMRMIVAFAVAVVIAFSVTNSFFFQPLTSINSHGRIAESIVVVFFSFWLLRSIAGNNDTLSITSIPMFWICSAWILYFCSSIFIFGMSNMIMFKDRQVNLWIWIAHAFFQLIHHIFIAIGFSKSKLYVNLLYRTGRN